MENLKLMIFLKLGKFHETGACDTFILYVSHTLTYTHTTYKHSTLSIIASEAQLAFGLYNCVFNVSHTCVELSALYNIGPIQIAHMDA